MNLVLKIGLLQLITIEGHWEKCKPPSRSGHTWTVSDLNFVEATRQSVFDTLLSLPNRHIMFWGDSTARQVYLDVALLASMQNNSFDDICDKGKWLDVYWHKSDPRLASERVEFDDFNVKCSPECGKDCSVRQWRYFKIDMGREAVGIISHYGTGRLNCPDTSVKSFNEALKAVGCPDALVIGSDLWPCRWGWKGYNHSSEIQEVARRIDERCPNALKIWKTANFLESRYPFYKCVDTNRHLAASLVPEAWYILDAWSITADPHLPKHGPHKVPISMMIGGRHMSPIGVRALSSSVLSLVSKDIKTRSPGALK